MILRILPLLSLAFSLGQMPLHAEDPDTTLKPEYRESTASGTTTVTARVWKTSRNGELILKHAEKDPTQSGKFDMADTVIYHDGKKVLLLTTVQKTRTSIFYPESGLKVLQTDSDGDGTNDRIVLSDAKDQIVDCFILAADGRLAALSDEALKKEVDAQKKYSETMKDFDKTR